MNSKPAMSFYVHTSSKSAEKFIQRARQVEELGFAGIFVADAHIEILDPFQLVAIAAARARTLEFGIAVTNLVFRDPTLLASSAASADQITGGRFILGIGTGDGTTFTLGRRPTRIDDLEAGVRTIRGLLRGGTVGTPFGPIGLSFPMSNGVGVYLSVEGPRGLRAAGRVADGVILGSGFDVGVLDWVRGVIAEGAGEVGRDPRDIDLIAAGIIYVSEDGGGARELVRPRLANRAHQNFRYSLETVPASEREGVKRFMAAFDISKPLEERVPVELVTDYLVDRFSIAGTPEHCAQRIVELRTAGLSRFMLTPPEPHWEETVEMWSTQVMPLVPTPA